MDLPHPFLLFLLLLAPTLEGCLKSDNAKGGGSHETYASTRRKDTWWLEKHEKFVQHSRLHGEEIKLLFLGDSITEDWNTVGNLTFHKYFDKYGAANYGVSADRTQHLLWRVRNGIITETLRPMVIVLLIGTNNFPHNTNQEIFKGVKAITMEIRNRLPFTKILLLGLLPRTSETQTKRVNQINKLITALDDNMMIWYFDLGRYFFMDDRLVQELYTSDLLHLSSKGYEMWGMAMSPVIKEMMEVVFEPE